MAIMGGNVGIGTTAPGYPLSISPGNADRGIDISHIKTTSGQTYGIYVYLEKTGPSGATIGVRSNTFGDGVGTTSTYAIKGEAAAISMGDCFGVYGESTGNGQRYGVYGEANIVYGDAVYADGHLVYTGSLINASDKKLKKNEQNLSGILPKLMRLQSKSYYFRTDEYKTINLPQGSQFGIIAQELEKEFPELVVDKVHPAEYDDEENKISDNIHYKGVKSMELIPLLLQGMKEQQVMIENLQKEMKNLKQIINEG